MTDPPLDVVVVTHNSSHVIEQLLDSLPAALDGAAARVLAVDNGSIDDTVPVLAQRSDCTVVQCANLGYAAGINRGVRALAGAGPILVLNPDVSLEAGSVRLMLEALSTPGTGIVAPRVHSADGSVFRSMRREPTLLRALGLGRTGRPMLDEYVGELTAYDRPQIVDWALGAVLLVSRECHEALGGWDESFFLYGEETDFCLRARDLGFATRYEPEAHVTHVGGQSGQSSSTHAMQIVNRVRLYRRRHGLVASVTYFGLTVLSEFSWVLRGNDRSRTAIVALLFPRRRPAELRCSDRLVPK